MKIVLLIRQLNDGGAQRQITLLARGLFRAGHEVYVVTFYGGGRFLDPLKECGVPVLSLDKRDRWDVFPFLVRLVSCFRRLKPQVIYSFLGVANILAVISRVFVPSTCIVLGVRSSFMDLAQYDWLHRVSFRLECLLSPFADLVITNSIAGRDYAVAHGFPARKTIVVANGVDTDAFRPDVVCRERVRAEWGITSGEKLVGIVGRLDPMKDHPTFLRAASQIAARRREVKFICVGDGTERYGTDLRRLTSALDLEDRVRWTGGMENIPCVLNALDVLVSASYGEGFPNVVAEAMACGVPCVVTNVGDSATIVGRGGLVVPERDPARLAQAVDELLTTLEGGELCSEAARLRRTRERIVAEYGAAVTVQHAERALMEIVDGSN